jgi:hypothetical protein
MSNPHYDPEFLETWLQRIARLRVLTDMLAPWDVDPNLERWKRGLGHGPEAEDILSSHMLDWQVWLHSLTAAQREQYQTHHPEPPGWGGFYKLVFSHPTSSDVPEDRGPDIYWDSLQSHYVAVFGVA